MKKRLISVVLALVLVLGALPFTFASAETTEDGFVYEINDGKATITDYTGSVTELVIPDTLGGYPVTAIGYGAFTHCTAFTSVTIPEGVADIGRYAFYDCTGLTSVNIPKSVTAIGCKAFYRCVNLTRVDITDIAAWCNIDFKPVYDNSGDSDMPSDEHTGEENPLFYAENLYVNGELLKELVIPKGITTIKRYSFINCSGLTSVTFPSSIVAIEYGAFSGCTGLATVSIPSSLKTIGDFGFNNCTSLLSLTISEGVTTIGKWAFYNCQGLPSVILPDSLTTIDNGAFEGCSGLVSVAIGKNASIGAYAFRNCKALTDLSISNGVTDIGYYAFSGCTSLESVTIPDSVTTIEGSAFYNCSALTTIMIGNGLNFVGSDAFYGCRINAVYISDLEKWCSIDFANFESNPISSGSIYLNGEQVKNLVIPNGVTRIGNYTFSNCKSITSVVFPDTVTSIGFYAFYNCTWLSQLSLSEGLVSIDGAAFSDCTRITEVEIPNSVKTIGASAFYLCTRLQKVTLSNELITIGNSAFYNCSALTEINIPSTVTYIGDSAFQLCKKLGVVTISDNVKFIGYRTFLDTEYYRNESNWEDDILYIGNHLIGAKETLVGTYRVREGTITIGGSAFYNCKELTEISIPDSVVFVNRTAVLNTAYYANENNWDDGLLLYLGDHLIAVKSTDYGEFSLRETTKSISNGVFAYNELISRIEIPSGVQLIGVNAFYSCPNLKSVTIPRSVTDIGIMAFGFGYDAENYEEYVVEDLVINGYGNTAAQQYAVDNGISFVDLDAPVEPDVPSEPDEPSKPQQPTTSFTVKEEGDGVTIIGYTGEETNVVIPQIINGKAVVGIAGGAFKGMVTLTSVTIPDSVVTIAEDAFEGCNESLKLLGGEGSVAQTFAKNNGFDFQVVGESAPDIPETPSDVPETPTDVISAGDLTGDQKVNAKDALEVLKAAVGKVQLTDEQKAAADVNTDGNINAKDALEILKHAVGKPSALDNK